MKVLIGGLYHESNTFNPFYTTKEDFVIIEGEEMFDRVCSTEVFKENNIEVIPSIYATALSSGIVKEEDFWYFANKILEIIKLNQDIEGIWLHLHGAMTVENMGSAELALLKEIRKIIGIDIPISLTLDIHGNIPIELVEYANIIRSYRTVPHIDQCETEKITAKLLVDVIKSKIMIEPVYEKVPLIISGEKALGNKHPLKSIFKKIKEYEKIEGILAVSYFIGFAWADVKHSNGCVIVIPENNGYSSVAKEIAKELNEYIYEMRESFKFDALALPVKESIEYAINAQAKPIFISDSGDNTTGGAIGSYTVLLKEILKVENPSKKICVASIYDEETYNELANVELGKEVDIKIGDNLNRNSQKIRVKGKLKAKGNLLGYLGGTKDVVGKTCTININENIDIVIANKGHSFITLNHFKESQLNINDYDIIIVKQGYLFPELAEISQLEILSLTPGATYQLVEELSFKNVKRPIYPLDK